MKIVKLLGILFLAAYLIFTGLVQVANLVVRPGVFFFFGLVALAAGVLILISLISGCCHPCEPCDRDRR